MLAASMPHAPCVAKQTGPQLRPTSSASPSSRLNFSSTPPLSCPQQTRGHRTSSSATARRQRCISRCRAHESSDSSSSSSEDAPPQFASAAVPVTGEELDRQAPVNSQRHVLSNGEVIEYIDSATDVAFIALVRQAYARIAGWQSPRVWKDGSESYKGMVEVSKALMKGRSADEQLAAVIKGFPRVPPLFRRIFPYSKWGAEVNAKITPAFFTWLVGPMEARDVEINGQTQKSSVHIKRCRYLAESTCAGMCINLCKSPTQAFFSEQLGMPLSMEPNFEDYSCDMVFGKAPLPRELDPAFAQGCLSLCTTAQAASKAEETDKPCYKLQ